MARHPCERHQTDRHLARPSPQNGGQQLVEGLRIDAGAGKDYLSLQPVRPHRRAIRSSPIRKFTFAN